jgi:ribosome-associated toxin RatA of RatAB toxin-antitoxin module
VVAWLAVVVVLAGSAAAREQPWERVTERDGMCIDQRAVEGSSAREVRATVHSPLAPAALMATIWRHEEYVEFMPNLRRLDVLRDDGDSKLVYEQLDVPIVKNRDLTLRIRRTFERDTGTYEISSEVAPDEGPPPSDDFVRVRTSTSRWRLVPAGGGTDIEYTLHTDGGGAVPGWMAKLILKEVTAKILRSMLDRAQRNAGRDGPGAP